mmetsp:Transcript_66248/g.117187  ORF Transcript_66248/g.117187 Transcript_66248/m.117187 type:complete len:97 (-) Transcript_66248:22-312(-)
MLCSRKCRTRREAAKPVRPDVELLQWQLSEKLLWERQKLIGKREKGVTVSESANLSRDRLQRVVGNIDFCHWTLLPPALCPACLLEAVNSRWKLPN